MLDPIQDQLQKVQAQNVKKGRKPWSTASSVPDFYALFGVDRDASRDKITLAYEQVRKQLESNQSSTPTVKEEQLSKIDLAYGVLIDAPQKEEYDRDLEACHPLETDNPLREVEKRKKKDKIRLLIEWENTHPRPSLTPPPSFSPLTPKPEPEPESRPTREPVFDPLKPHGLVDKEVQVRLLAMDQYLREHAEKVRRFFAWQEEHNLELFLQTADERFFMKVIGAWKQQYPEPSDLEVVLRERDANTAMTILSGLDEVVAAAIPSHDQWGRRYTEFKHWGANVRLVSAWTSMPAAEKPIGKWVWLGEDAVRILDKDGDRSVTPKDLESLDKTCRQGGFALAEVRSGGRLARAKGGVFARAAPEVTARATS